MSLSSLNSIGQTAFELESGNENVDKCRTHQSNRRVGYRQEEVWGFGMMSLDPENMSCLANLVLL